MDINKENIELIIFEYLEGNLSPNDVQALIIFLEKNTEFKELFDVYTKTKLFPEKNIRFEKKNLLKKTEEDNEFELLCIRYIENDLSEKEIYELNDQLSKNQEKKKIFEEYKKTLLTPNNSIEFSQKESLKKYYTNFDKRCIEYIEGQLNTEDAKKLVSEANTNQDKKNTFDLFQKTKLKPDYSLIFPNKDNLKKSTSTKTYSLRWAVSAAASIILIIYISISFYTNHKFISHQIAVSNQTNPLIIRTIQNKNKASNRNKTIPIQTKKQKSINPTLEPNVQNDFAFENKKDSVQQIENKIIAHDENIHYAQHSVEIKNDSIVNEVLNKLFAQNKFNYFHQMIEEVGNEKQAYLPNHKGSWWNVLENGSNFISEHTGTKVAVKEYKYEDNQRVKQEITLGNFSFSRSISKK